MKEDLKDLTQKESMFIADTIHKEIFFALQDNEPSAFTRMIADLVESERTKIEDDIIWADDAESDIGTATSILHKLNFNKEEL